RDLTSRSIDTEESVDLAEDTAFFLGLEPYSSVIKKFEWLGLFRDDVLPDETNVMDMFCALLQKKLAMADDDLDLIVLHHQFLAEYAERKDCITSTLISTGEPQGNSAMSKTVSLPAAIGTALILQDKIRLPGVHIPVKPEIYEPVLHELEGLGIHCVERAHTLQ
ncbi:MAG: saccharopine dehydrogenase, partial [bacterium]|nr:saccharopine dehydrogenase [bacterium]